MIRYLSAALLLFVALSAYTQCSTTVTVPADITLCNPDDVVLNGQINGPYLNFLWSSTNGYNNNTELSPTVNVTQTTTYVLQSRSIPGPGDNIIVNGDFESGNTGFSSQYNYVATAGPLALWTEGTYAITDNPKSYHQNFKPCTDHTGGGNMQVVNGAASLSKVWCQTVTVMPNTTYVFQAWAASVENSSPAKLQFSMNGSLIGNIFNVPGATCVWSEFYELWDSGPTTSVEICITNQNFSLSGNDFALDDIYFAPTCVSKDSVKVTVVDFIPSIEGEDLLDCAKLNTTLTGVVTPINPLYTYNWSTSNGSYNNGSNENEIVVDREGNYTLVVIDENNCIRSTEYVVNEDFEVPEAELAVSDTIDCSHTSALISVDIGLQNTSFAWTGPNNFSSYDKDIIVYNPGIYEVTITNETNHCTYNTTAEVIGAFDGPQFDLTKDGSLTCSKSKVMLASTNIDSSFTYLWTGNGISAAQQSLPRLEVSSKGSYTLEVTDSDGCASIKSITVDSVAALLTLQQLPQDVLSCNNPTVVLKEKYNGSVDSIVWYGPGGFISNAAEPTIHTIGNYYLIALDTNGCKALDTITIHENTFVPIPQFTTKDIDCILKKGFITLMAHDSLASLYDVASHQKLSFDVPLEYTNEGIYQYEVVAKNGCKDTIAIALSKNIDFPESTIDFNNIDCIKQSSDVKVTTNIAASYAWSSANGFSSTDKDVVITKVGTYYLTTTSAIGCTSIDSIEITADTLKPKVEFSFDQLSCKTLSTIPRLLNGDSSNIVIQWQGPQQFSSNKVLPLITKKGNYQVKATGHNGCVALYNYTVTADERRPDATINPENLLNCKITSVEKSYNSISGLANATWHIGNDTVGGNKIILSKPGNFFLTGLHPISGCNERFDFSMVQDVRKPDGKIIGNDTITCKQAAVQRLLLSNTPGLNVEWYYKGTLISNVPLLSINEAGLYKAVIQHPISYCIDSVDCRVAVDVQKPIVNLTVSDITCKSPIANVDIDALADYTYIFNQSGFVAIDKSHYTTNVGGNHTLVAEGKNGCIEKIDFEIKQNTALPQFTIENGEVGCNLKPALVNITSDGNTYQYYININGIKTLVDNNAIALMPGKYTCTAINPDNGCESSKETTIVKIENGPVSISCDLSYLCEKKSYAYLINEVTSGTPPYIYYVDSASVELEKIPQSINSGRHSLKVIDANGCSAQNIFDIEASQDYTLSTDAEIKIKYGESTRLELKTELSSDQIQSIQWIPSTGLSCDDCLSPLCNTLDNAQYTVVLTDRHGCTIETETRILVDFVVNVYHPNIFNPANDRFTLYGTPTIKQVDELAIFDRWGNNVFVNKSFPVNDPSIGWDGSFNGEALSIGVYVFYAKVRTVKEEVILVKGDITLIR